MTERQVRFAQTFNPGTLGPETIEAVKKLDKGDKREFPLGRIYGFIRGVSYGNNPNDPTVPSCALIGIFEGVPADPERPLIHAPKCFLPSSVQKMMQEAIEAANNLKPPEAMPARGKPVNHRIDQQIKIDFDIGVQRHDSPIGFTFYTNSRIKNVEVESLLEEFRNGAALPSGNTRALPAPKKSRSKKK